MKQLNVRVFYYLQCYVFTLKIFWSNEYPYACRLEPTRNKIYFILSSTVDPYKSKTMSGTLTHVQFCIRLCLLIKIPELIANWGLIHNIGYQCKIPIGIGKYRRNCHQDSRLIFRAMFCLVCRGAQNRRTWPQWTAGTAEMMMPTKDNSVGSVQNETAKGWYGYWKYYN